MANETSADAMRRLADQYRPLGDDGKKHAYATTVHAIRVAMFHLTGLSGRRIPFLAATELDTAVIALRKAIHVLDEFRNDE